MKYPSVIKISFPTPKLTAKHTCSCHEANKRCRPSFVFSISGQVGFRQALYHLTTCLDKDCSRLKAKITKAMKRKLHWLLKEDVLLGCVHLQPSIYGKNKILLNKENFSFVAHHLSHCPKESCAQLRRSSLLTVRKALSPKSDHKLDQ